MVEAFRKHVWSFKKTCLEDFWKAWLQLFKNMVEASVNKVATFRKHGWSFWKLGCNFFKVWLKLFQNMVAAYRKHGWSFLQTWLKLFKTWLKQNNKFEKEKALNDLKCWFSCTAKVGKGSIFTLCFQQKYCRDVANLQVKKYILALQQI